MKRLNIFAGFWFGILLISLAACAMVLLAWKGLQNHRDLVWSEARDEAEEIADRFQGELQRELRVIRFYNYPPRPGALEFSAEASLSDLREQMDSNERTVAGLPVAVLAAYEVAKRTGSVRDGELARDLAMKRWPDLTSPLILERLAILAKEHSWEGDFSAWKENWKSDELARDLIREERPGLWFFKGESLHRVEQLGEGEYSYFMLSQDSRDWTNGRYFGISLGKPGRVLGDAGKVILQRSLQDVTLSVGVLDPKVMEKEWRSRRDGTVILLSLAALVIAVGVWMVMKGVLKEKKVLHAKSQFVASVTHELRAPVGSMRLMADALEGGKLTAEKEGEFHRLMARESGRLSVLIENVMDLARVEDGQRVVHKEQFLFSELSAEVCEMMALPALEKKLRFKQEGPELVVEADALMIRQVLVNLIDNAIKFSPSESEIIISWGEAWWFAVADQGEGIPEEDREKVFERFYRRENELRRKTQGVGIGLSLVKELVGLHGGEVKVEQAEGALLRVDFSKK